MAGIMQEYERKFLTSIVYKIWWASRFFC